MWVIGQAAVMRVLRSLESCMKYARVSADSAAPIAFTHCPMFELTHFLGGGPQSLRLEGR